jgi:hypothetical protein
MRLSLFEGPLVAMNLCIAVRGEKKAYLHDEHACSMSEVCADVHKVILRFELDMTDDLSQR